MKPAREQSSILRRLTDRLIAMERKMSPPVPPPELPFTAYTSRFFMLIVFLGCAGFVYLGYLGYSGQIQPRTTGIHHRSVESVKFWSIITMLFFGIGIPFGLLHTIKRKFLFSIDTAGIRLQKNGPIIVWDNIQDFTLTEVKHSSYVTISLKNNQAYYGQLGWFDQMMTSLSNSFTNSSIKISIDKMSRHVYDSDLLNWLEYYKKQYGTSQ